MMKRMSIVLAAVMVLLTLAGCAQDIWGDQNLLEASSAVKGTAFSDEKGTFTLYAPDTFRDATAEDADGSNLMLTDGELTIRVTVLDYVQNLAVTTEEDYAEEYKNLGMDMISYTRGKGLGVNGLKIVGDYEDNGSAMQQLQYAANVDGHFVVFTCSYPTSAARNAKKNVSSILGSFSLAVEAN